MTNSFHSRSNRYEKKRKGTKMMTWLMGAAGLMIIAFVALFIFGGNETDGTAKQAEPSESVSVEEEEEKENTDGDNDDSETDENAPEQSSGQQDSETSIEEGEEQKEESSSQEELTVIENSDDENVKRTIKKNWKPLQTEQTIEGEHRITYDTESQDWIEMEQVVRDVTGLTEDNMITQYIGNGGTPNKAIATVYNRNNKAEVYRVYLEWIEGTGFQAQKMDELNRVPQ